MSTIQQIHSKAFYPLKQQITDSSKEYVPILTTENVSAKYQITDITVSSELQVLISNKDESVWENNTAVNIGQGETGQEFVSINNEWKYTCVTNGYWTRALIIQNKIELFLDTVDDNGGLLTIAQLNTNYPSAVPIQRIKGVRGYYERDVADNWNYVNTEFTDGASSDRKWKTIFSNYALTAADHGSVIGLNTPHDATLDCSNLPQGFSCTLVRIGADWPVLSYNGDSTKFLTSSVRTRVRTVCSPDGVVVAIE